MECNLSNRTFLTIFGRVLFQKKKCRYLWYAPRNLPTISINFLILSNVSKCCQFFRKISGKFVEFSQFFANQSEFAKNVSRIQKLSENYCL